MMRTEYIERQFCKKCLRETEHVLFTYLDSSTLTCQFCQHIEVVVEDEMPRSNSQYTIIAIHEERFRTVGRRYVLVELKQVRDDVTSYFTIKYPAYGNRHYPGSMARYPDNAVISYIEAEKIADEIKKIFKEND